MKRIKEYKLTLIVTSIITLLPMLIGLALWNQLPSEIATHFDANGIANGWSSKPVAVFGLPAFILACHLLCTLVTSMDPKRQRIGDKIFKLILWLCPVISLFCTLAVYGNALGLIQNTAVWGTVLLGVVFILIGNYMPKCRQNYTVGIKLPWTLHDEENWNRTHRMAGKAWVAGGALLLILSILGYGQTWIIPVVLGMMVLIPTAYSFLYYRKHKQ